MTERPHQAADADGAHGGGDEGIRRVCGRERVREGLLVALAHPAAEQLVVQAALSIEEQRQQQRPPRAAHVNDDSKRRR